MKKLFALLLITALLIASLNSCVLNLWSESGDDSSEDEGGGNQGGSEGEGGGSEGSGEGDGDQTGEPGGTGGSDITGDDKPFLDDNGWTDPRG